LGFKYFHTPVLSSEVSFRPVEDAL